MESLPLGGTTSPPTVAYWRKLLVTLCIVGLAPIMSRRILYYIPSRGFLDNPPLRRDGAAIPLESEDPKEGHALRGRGQPRTIFFDAPRADCFPHTSLRNVQP